MNGSGTSSDPFIIMTAEDLCGMLPEYCYALGCDIDFGSSPYCLDIPSITIGSSLDGRGHMIRNIVCCKTDIDFNLFTVSGNVSVSNITFENIRLTGKRTSFFGGSGLVTLSRCNFALKVSWHQANSTTTSIFNNGSMTINATECNFVVLAYWTKQRSLFRSCTLTRCQIRFTMVADSAKGSSENTSQVVYRCTMNNCTFFTDLTVNADTTAIFSYSCTYTNCCIRLSAHGTYTLWWQNDDFPLVTVADITGIESTVSKYFNLPSTLKQITPEQMQDAEYLTSLGIECVEVDE